MKAIQTTMHDFIAESRFFKIPDFQRPYAWKHSQGEAYWESLVEAVNSSKRHYFGSVVFFEDGEHRVVIDGQQRLTTTLLFLTACYHALVDDSRKSHDDTFTAEWLGKTFLYNEDDGELRVILRGATTDRTTFDRILRRKTLPIDELSKLYQMYEYFVSCIASVDKIDPYIGVLHSIDVISILLQPEDDNPQIIFENINATGEPLTDGDKIRNYALMLNTEEAREMVFNKYWQHIERVLTRSDGYSGVGEQYITDFFKVFLTMQYSEKAVTNDSLYATFKQYYKESTSQQSIEQLVGVWSNITSVLDSYIYLEFGDDITKDKLFSDFDESIEAGGTMLTAIIKSKVTFFVQLLELFKQNLCTRNDIRSIIDAIRKHQMRSLIVGLKFDLTHLTAKRIQKLQADWEMKSYFDAYLWYMDGEGEPEAAKSPTDKQLRDFITNSDIDDKLAHIIFLELDQAKHEQHPDLYDVTRGKIDHIIPRPSGNYLPEVWKEALGRYWYASAISLHGKLANMAIVDYTISGGNSNKEESFDRKLNSPFGQSRGIKYMRNYTSRQIADNYTEWTTATLEDRNKWLCNEILGLYAIPKVMWSEKMKNRYAVR